jgi:dTDP-3-amino-3,4,6-trideoxy-alpha-D-glucose transaminase
MSISNGHDVIKTVDLARLWLEVRRDVLEAVDRVGESGWYILGPEVRRFETMWAKATSCLAAVACASGTDAIELGLRALDLKPGQRVATTPLSAFATTTGIVRAGGVPVFLDTDPNGNLGLDGVGEWAAEQTEPVFVVPVHLYGNPVDMGLLDQLQAAGAVIVEDCAQAHMATWNGRLIGTAGMASAFSFYPTKNVPALGDAGAVSAGTVAVATRLAILREYGQSAKYVHADFGINSRMDEVQAAVLSDAMLPRIGGWVERRREIASRYLASISHPNIRPLDPDALAGPSWHLFPVFIQDAPVASFRAWLSEGEIETALHYPTLIPDQAASANFEHEIVGDLDQARRLARSEVSLPMHAFLTDAELDRVVDACNRWRPT